MIFLLLSRAANSGDQTRAGFSGFCISTNCVRGSGGALSPHCRMILALPLADGRVASLRGLGRVLAVWTLESRRLLASFEALLARKASSRGPCCVFLR